jgi:hypothetical protein
MGSGVNPTGADRECQVGEVMTKPLTQKVRMHE